MLAPGKAEEVSVLLHPSVLKEGSIGYIPLAPKPQSALKISLLRIKRVRMENKKNILIFTDRTSGLKGKWMRALPLYRAEPPSWHTRCKSSFSAKHKGKKFILFQLLGSSLLLSTRASLSTL